MSEHSTIILLRVLYSPWHVSIKLFLEKEREAFIKVGHLVALIWYKGHSSEWSQHMYSWKNKNNILETDLLFPQLLETLDEQLTLFLAFSSKCLLINSRPTALPMLSLT